MAAQDIFDLNKALDNTILYGEKILKQWDSKNNAFANMSQATKGAQIGINGMKTAMNALTMATHAQTAAEKVKQLVQKSDPIYLIAAAVTAATVGILTYAASIENVETEYEKLTLSSQKQYDSMEQANKQYKNALELFGENSKTTKDFREQMEKLSGEYYINKTKTEDLTAANEKLMKSHQDAMDKYKETMIDINHEEVSTAALINKLTQLDAIENKSNAVKNIIRDLANDVNDKIEGANFVPSDFNDIGTKAIAYQLVIEEANSKAYDAEKELYIQSVGDEANKNKMLETERKNLELYNNEYDYLRKNQETLAVEDVYYYSNVSDAKEGMFKSKKNIKNHKEDLEKFNRITTEHQTKMEAVADNFSGITDFNVGVNASIRSVSEELENLVTEYDAVYDSAYNSISATLGMWNKMDNTAKTSAKTLDEALQSQIDYMDNLEKNMNSLLGRDIAGLKREDLKQFANSLKDGSQESAAILAGLDDASDSDIKSLVEKRGIVENKKRVYSADRAEEETDFTERFNELEKKMITALCSTNVSYGMKMQGGDAINAFAEGIREGIGEAESAAQAVSDAVTGVFNPLGISTFGMYTSENRNKVTQVEGKAHGTTYAPNIFMAGEEGPELIVGMRGSTVFPADETNRIVSAVNHNPVVAAVPKNFEAGDGENRQECLKKKIELDINGSGRFEVNGKIDENKAADLLLLNLKPMFIRMLKQEVFEEGDRSYDF